MPTYRARRLRIAFGRIAQETNALSPLRTTLDDFRAHHLFEGTELLRRCGMLGNEAPGFLPWAELSGFLRAARTDRNVEPIPLLSAWAVPSGPLTRDCFEFLLGELVARLERARPLDGVFLSLHGAMGVEGLSEPESRIVELARKASGTARIAVSRVRHGNLSRELGEGRDGLVAYATNPHRDFFGTGRRAGEMLIRTLRGEVEPVMAWRSLPMLLGGGPEVDLLPPMRAIFRRARQMERQDRRVLSTSVLMCHPWNNARTLGWSTLAVADRERGRAEACADELAEACWAVRNVETPRFASAEEAVACALEARWARRLGLIVMSDASDVVSAGATGDSTHLIRALHEHGEGMTCYAAIRDPEVARALGQRRLGEEVAVRVGAKLDPTRSEPLDVEGVLRASRVDPGFGRRVLLDLDPPSHVPRKNAGKVRLVITEGPALVFRPSFYRSLGLPLRAADIVVVKSFFPFRLYFLPWARRTLYVRTRGLTDLDAAFALALDGPVHPRDRIDDWRAIDRARRGVFS